MSFSDVRGEGFLTNAVSCSQCKIILAHTHISPIVLTTSFETIFGLAGICSREKES